MQLSLLPVILSALPVAFAQYGGGGGNTQSSTSTSSAAPATTASSSGPALQTIAVGNGGLAFTPSSLVANVGDSIEFVFYPSTHSIVQSSFAAPCNPLANGTGFFSGGFTTASGMNNTSFTITVNDTKPIWFYCGYPGHCERGMAGVINPPTSGPNTLQAYQTNAAGVTNPAKPPAVQGGVIGPVKAAGSQSSGSSTSSSSGASSTSSKSAGAEARGGVQWILLGLTSVAAAAFGSLIL